MKTCEQYSELVPALAEEVLSPADAVEVRSHIEGCPACAESWRLQELISRHVRETDLADKPDYYWAKQRKHILDQVGFSTSRVLRVDRPRRSFVKIAIAAAAVLLVAVSAFALLRKTEEPSNGVVRKKTWMDDPPVVKEDPKETQESPEPAAKKDEGLVQPQEPQDPKPNEPLVDEKKPEPKKNRPTEGVAKGDPPPSKKETTPENPPKEETAPRKPEAVAILPGSALYAHVLAQEQADILMPLDESKSPVLKERTTVEQALAILKAASARIEDIRQLTEKDAKADVHELVDAYCTLVSEGAMPIMIPLAIEGKTLGASRKELRAQQAELETKFSEELKKGSLAPALQTCLAANDLKIRRHSPRSSNETGALAAAVEVAMFVKYPGSGTMTVPLRAKWGQTVAGRIQKELLEDVKAGRVVEADGHFAAYRTIAESLVRMIEWLDAKDAVRICAETRRELLVHHSLFRSVRAAEPTRPILAAGPRFIESLIEKINVIEENAKLGRLPRPDRKDPPTKDPKDKDPEPSKEPPPKPPPFGEDNPPSPPPPPPPPFGEQP